ncbi:radical SAM/SPASM domain-containing protein [Magnetofaba australis]|uniref:Putative radical SAM protein n=1 Tax=Magnetofaba australis IT-1 TaxID=1434232 RepID=A0A1Y2K4B8_9PROT|nr:radical SAM/SPASM domain-containing protein [Magnetofaba australis]OSM04205.1 putative radical SAM protein [Magnetofaba australis IT-1]
MSVMQKIKIGGGKLADHPERVQTWLAGGNPGPLAIEVAIVHGCNHNCAHCGPQQFDPYDPKKTFMDRDVFLKFLEDFRAEGGAEVYFAGSGEPTLHPDFPEFVQRGHELGLAMTLSSNGLPLVPKRAEKILPYLTWARFSINGGNAPAHARVHQVPERDFHKLVENLTFMDQLRRAQDLPFQLAMQMVTYDLNWDSLPDMTDLFQRVGGDRLIIRNKINKDGQLNAAPAELFPLLEAADRIPGVEIRWPSFPRPGESLEAPPADWRTCHGVRFRTNMDFQGNLHACFRHWYKASDFGNIYQQSFTDIWRSERKRALFDEIASGADIPLCAKWCQVSFDNRELDRILAQQESHS